MEIIATAAEALAGSGHPIATAVDHVPNEPGLYAIHAHSEVWRELGLTAGELGVPLYVGKAEDSLVTRELRTHFAVGNGTASTTGSSTVRRSFAALLRQPLKLRAVPRNLNKPGYFSNYSLEPDGDHRLTECMHANLTLAVWPKPQDAPQSLRTIEKGVIIQWSPPLNLTDVAQPSKMLKQARMAMANEALSWSHEAQPL